MSRTLGSFNQRVNLPRHREDYQPSHPPRIAKLRPEVIPEERGGKTGGEKFAAGRGRSGSHHENRRLAGTALNIDLRTEQEIKTTPGLKAAFAPPLAGAAESRTAASAPQLPSMYSNY